MKNFYFKYLTVTTFVLLGAFIAWVLATSIVEGPKPPPKKHKEIVLEDGTRCVVLKGIYSDNAITCDWSKE